MTQRDPRTHAPQEPLDTATREAALVAVLADIIERTCVVVQPASVVQSPIPTQPDHRATAA